VRYAQMIKSFNLKTFIETNLYFFNRSNALIESGIHRHWENLEQETFPLVIRYHGYEFKRDPHARGLSFNDLNWSVYLLIVGLSLASISLVIELLNNKVS